MPAKFIRIQIKQALEEDLEEKEKQDWQISARKYFTEISLWLELTRWPEYLAVYNLAVAASLGVLSDPGQEPLLALFTESVKRLI